VLGALSRYYIGLFCLAQQRKANSTEISSILPIGTLFVNLTGAFMIGLITTLATRYSLPKELQMFLEIGFLGAYTTFSSYILEIKKLTHDNRQPTTGLLYGLGSPLLGMVLIKLGIWVGHEL